MSGTSLIGSDTHESICGMYERMRRNLVMESLLRAVEATQPPAGLLHHSDKGSQ